MFEKVIQITSSGSRIGYSPIGLYCDNCHAEIHVGQDHRKSFWNVICKCRWQLVHVRELPRDSFQWELFWRPWRSEPEPGVLSPKAEDKR
jgi:hypothetical protein